MRGPSHWVTPENPRSIGAPAHLAVCDKRRKRGGNGRSACTDQMSDESVRQPKRDVNAVGAHVTPTLGELPEERKDPGV